MKKRFIALGMAAMTAMSSVNTASLTAFAVEAKDEISGDLAVTTFFSVKTNAVELKSGDTYTFKFKNTSTAANSNYENYIMAVTGAIGNEYIGAEQEVLIIRADAWGWGGGMSDFVAPDSNSGNKLIFSSDINFDTWKAETKAGIDCEVTLARTGDKLDYTAKLGTYTVSTSATSGKALPETCYVFFTGEKCELTGFTTEKYTIKIPDSEQTPTDPEQTPTDPEQTPTDPEQTPTDPEQTATDVITSEDGDNIQVEYKKNQFEDKVKLSTKLLGAEDDDYKNIDLKKFVKDTENVPENISFVAYNISLLDMENQTVQPNGKVTVKIACPDEYNDASSKVYRINDNGSLTNMLAVLKDGYFVFESNHFSTYVITAEDLFAGQGFVYGDVNGDGKIDTKDAVMIKRYLAEFDDAKEQLDTNAGDVTGDTKVSSADAVKLLQALAGQNVELGR